MALGHEAAAYNTPSPPALLTQADHLPALTSSPKPLTMASQEDTSQEDTSQGDTSQGDTSQGDTSQGDTSQGDTSQGDTSQGDTSQGDTSQGDTSQGDTSQGKTSQGDTLQGDTSQEDTSEKNPRVCLLVCGFAAIGKTYLAENNLDGLCGYKIVDLDSSNYSKDAIGEPREDFKDAYSNAWLKIMDENKDSNVIILLSTHLQTREGLVQNKMKYTLVHPPREAKVEWLRRMKSRNSDDSLIEHFRDNWDAMIDSCGEQDDYATTLVLGQNEYLSDVMKILIHLNKPTEGTN
ncbi:hypothetical protein J3459_016752 [Metarhizium acridum]|nr:hypothetical protein J3459_016752 [Metarhizium acridum]